MTWWPGLLVLAVAVVVGVWWTMRNRGGPRSDLERKKDELVGKLRSLPEGTDEDARRRLELEAAQVMRELDREGEAAADAGASRRRPMLTGFLLGSASTALVAMLLFAATDEWRRNRLGSAGSPGAMAADHPPGQAVAASPEIERLQAALRANPGDLAARRQLAIAFVTSNQLFEAFQQSQLILDAEPNDFDARMVMGIVRLAMGGTDDAAQHFDTAIEQHPDDPAGYLYRGLAEERRGRLDEAIQIWRRGLMVAGGTHADLEKLIAEAEHRPPPSAQAVAPAAVASTAAAPTGAAFSVRVELAPGAATQGVLFAALRTGPTGPPVLVKRIESPTFPYDLQLTAADAMLGGDMPEAGSLTLRLDTDGNASTKGPEEPQAVVEVRRGEPARVVLGGS